MTNDQKQLLKAIGTFVLFKGVLYASIYYTAKWARKMAKAE